jgi:hypothetical protein
MHLSLVCEESDLTLESQRRLYFSHPYDSRFMKLMDRVLPGSETIPRFISLVWLTWWYLHQTDYVTISVEEKGEYPIRVLLMRQELKIDYLEEGETTILIPEEIDYTKLCNLFWIGEEEAHLPWYEVDTDMDFIVPELVPQLTNASIEARIRGNYADFDNSSSLFIKSTAVFQAFPEGGVGTIEYNLNFCNAVNDFMTNIGNLQYTGWRKYNRYRYYITEIDSFRLDLVGDETVLEFGISYIILLDWAYHHFMDHHLDLIAAYSGPAWKLEDLQKYAKETWKIDCETREDIIAKLNEVVAGIDWIDSISPDNL